MYGIIPPQISMNGWWDEYDKEEEENKNNDSSRCHHVWESVGRSPVLDIEWFNCKKCKMKKEDYDKSN